MIYRIENKHVFITQKNHVIISAREISGDDLIRLRNEVQSAQARGGFNFSTILEEIDKYKIVSE